MRYTAHENGGARKPRRRFVNSVTTNYVLPTTPTVPVRLPLGALALAALTTLARSLSTTLLAHPDGRHPYLALGRLRGPVQLFDFCLYLASYPPVTSYPARTMCDVAGF